MVPVLSIGTIDVQNEELEPRAHDIVRAYEYRAEITLISYLQMRPICWLELQGGT